MYFKALLTSPCFFYKNNVECIIGKIELKKIEQTYKFMRMINQKTYIMLSWLFQKLLCNEMEHHGLSA